MTFNFHRFSLFFILALSLAFTSCDEDSDRVIEPADQGFYVVNEGAFGKGNASISYYNRNTGQITNDVFGSKNNRPLGDQAQSLTIFGDDAFIIVQGSQKVEVIHATTFESKGTVSGPIENPRYMISVTANKAYLSDWGNGFNGVVRVIDMATKTVVKSIPTDSGPNRLLKKNDKVYVVNSGGYGYANTVSVIDIGSDELIDEIVVGDNPNSIEIDATGAIWVASGGMLAYTNEGGLDGENSTPGSISRIENDEETLRLSVDEASFSYPSDLNISLDGKTLYYTYEGGVYKLGTSATELSSQPFINKSYYEIAIDPITGNLIGTVVPDFQSSGKVEILDANGNVTKSLTAGIAPSAIVFKD